MRNQANEIRAQMREKAILTFTSSGSEEGPPRGRRWRRRRIAHIVRRSGRWCITQLEEHPRAAGDESIAGCEDELDMLEDTKCKPKLVRPAAEESGRAAAAAEAGPTSGGEDCGGDEAEGGGWGILRAATARFDHADGGARTAQGRRKDRGRRHNSDQRRRGTESGGAGPVRPAAAARGPTSGGAARVRPAVAQTRPTSGGDGLPRRRRRRVASAADLALRAATVRRRLTSSDGAATVQRRCGGSPAVVAESLRRWSRRVSGGGGGLAVKMGLEVKWVWRGENGFGGR
ncbi:hypothetical protein Scep_011771 [Stephania cephalantha]|uniref:Uncharacterized protein n=1 Tax=Stephania cephalantha TaxID=152367 RepID=A0AAP0JFS5_9MAGN